MIIRLEKTNREKWTVISTETLNDTRLKPEGLGLLVYLLSKPDKWEVRVSQIAKDFSIGRDKTRRILQHLAECGYAKLEPIRTKDGKVRGKRWIIFECPQYRQTENPSFGSPHRQPENTDVGDLPTSVKSGDIVRDLCIKQETNSIKQETDIGASQASAPSKQPPKEPPYKRKPIPDWNAADLLAYTLDRAAELGKTLVEPKAAAGRNFKRLLEWARQYGENGDAPQLVKELVDECLPRDDMKSTAYLLYEARRFFPKCKLVDSDWLAQAERAVLG